jgi:autotransporter-associated beta strand protein
MKNKRALALIVSVLLAAGSQAQTLLLSDDFNSPSSSASGFNDTLAVDQAGSLAPVDYTVTTMDGGDWEAQHGNGGEMLLVADDGGNGLTSTASLDHDFSADANAANKPLQIEFDGFVGNTTNSACWFSFVIGSVQNVLGSDGSASIGFLPTLGGAVQVYAGGSALTGGNHSGNTYILVLSDTPGTGSAFNGNGSVAKLYDGVNLVGTYSLSQLGAGQGYISFAGDPSDASTSWANFAQFDNLSVSLLSPGLMPPTASGVASPNPANLGSTVLFAVTVTNGSSTSITNVTLNAASLGASSALTLVSAGGGVYTNSLTLGNSLASANYALSATVTDANGLTGTANFSLSVNGLNIFNYTWDNGQGTWNWNLADTNWTGTTWVNSSGMNIENAIFSGTAPGTVTLTTNILANNITMSAGSGYGLNGNGDSLQVSGSLAVKGTGPGQPGITLSNGVFGVNQVITSPSSGDWGVLNITAGATVNVTNGINGSVGSPYTFELNLNGGTLTTPSITVADLHASWGNSFMTFNGTEVVAAEDNTNFIQTYGGYGNNNSLTVNSGGAVLNTAGHDVTINPSLIGSGGLTKKGAGTLTLNAAFAPNTYAGETVVQGGELSIGAVTALGGGALDVTDGAVVNLNYRGQIQVAGLTLGGAAQADGTYGATGSGATFVNDTFFTGSGVIYVDMPPANQTFVWTGAVNNNWDEASADWTNNVSFTEWFNNNIAPNSAVFDVMGMAQPNVNVVFTDTFYASDVIFNAAGYSISGNALTLGNSPNFIVNSDATINSVLQGSGGLSKTGNATLTLTGANNIYGGALTVASGTLEIGGNGGFMQSQAGGAVTVSNGATILISSTANNALPFNDNPPVYSPAWTVAGTINVTGGGANTIPGAGVVLNNGTLTGTPANASYGTFLATQSGANIITANGGANAISSDNFAVSGTLTLNTPQAGDSLMISSVFFDGFAGPGALLKTGAGTVALSGASTYSSNTIVNAGTLLVNGSIATGATVAGGTLGGGGTITGAVTINAGGTVTAGTLPGTIGTLTLSSDLTLNGNVLVNLNKSLSQSNTIFNVSGVLTNGNGSGTTLSVSNLGPALNVGDNFILFSEAISNGAALTILPPPGYTLNNNLAVDGSITVTGVPSTTPPTLGYSKTGSNLTFSWIGSGSLEWQSNTLSDGLGTNWLPYPNGTNGVTVTIAPTEGCVFFRIKQ